MHLRGAFYGNLHSGTQNLAVSKALRPLQGPTVNPTDVYGIDLLVALRWGILS